LHAEGTTVGGTVVTGSDIIAPAPEIPVMLVDPICAIAAARSTGGELGGALGESEPHAAATVDPTRRIK
jgi:hypothetical protein